MGIPLTWLNSQMAETTSPETQMPLSNWSLPVLEGSFAGVVAEIDRLTFPDHFKTALIADLDAALANTDHNFVKLHAHGQRHYTANKTHHIVLLDLETSKKNLL